MNFANHNILFFFSTTSLLFTGAIFGFFYAWVCSTMWGLDNIDPRVAIEAMQGMNASVRNAVFAPIFFGTPIVLLLTALIAKWNHNNKSALTFLLAGLVYLFGGAILTFSINVPMNEDLSKIVVPENIEEARSIWVLYSSEWQFWNITRTIFSGLALVLAAAGTWLAALKK